MIAGPGRPVRMPQESVLELASLLFDSPRGELAGRGEARRVARSLVRSCGQGLVPLAPDLAVDQLLGAAGFLWEPAFGPARVALAGAHLVGRRERLWVVGSGRFRRRLLARAPTWSGLRRRLLSADARSHWPRTELGRGGDRVTRARRLLADGRLESALELLAAQPGASAEALRISARARLGRLHAARRSLQNFDPSSLAEVELSELAETAVSVHSSLGRPEAADGWVERSLASREPAARRRALVAAATLALESGDLPEMERCLQLAAGSEAPWSWRRTAGLGALARCDATSACGHLGSAVRESRRQLGRYEAASIWNDLGVARAAAGDLAGAERALLHAVRLHDRIDGPRRTTLALFNLAEIRLRRGRLGGVREILDRSTRLDLESGNWRAVAHDRELRARYELARGRPMVALEQVDGALAELERRGVEARRSALQAVAARALGWLGRPRAAAHRLAGVGDTSGGLFESEELPALWALAGDRRRALAAVGSGPDGRVWQRVLDGDETSERDWSGLDELEPFRAARLIADVELVSSGCAPRDRLEWALAVLTRQGNRWLTGVLEGSRDGAWGALADYLGQRPGSARGLTRLFTQAGYPGVALSWHRAGVERQLLFGSGGGEELRARLAGGELVLAADRIDPVLRALFGLVVRDWRPEPMPPRSAAEGVIGECSALLAAFEKARRLAIRDVPILILGETGTGKELATRHVHRSSPRRNGPLVTLNSAAVSESLVLSDLFGHVRGAFTGAERDRAGVFEAARGGTVFLDELGDLPLQAQGMLLRVLQEGEVRRLGESRVRRVDVRVIAATHRPLERLVEEGRFRQDLFFRLAVGRVELPPLRERGADLDLLARHFLGRFSSDRRLRLSRGARARLRRHPWPGNVRELESCLAVAVALADDELIRARHLGLPESGAATGGGYHQRVLDFRRRLIADALDAADGNRAAAARSLGMSRQALSYLVRSLGLG